MKLVIEIPVSGGVLKTMWCKIDLDGRDSLKNVLNRQEIGWSVCEKKNLDQKVILEKKLEHFSKKKLIPQNFVKDFPAK